jgi:hypothetical protein
MQTKFYNNFTEGYIQLDFLIFWIKKKFQIIPKKLFSYKIAFFSMFRKFT